VTIEDLVEEIVGDIKDEYDREEALFERISDDQYVFDAKISIYDFNEIMGMHLDNADYETLGGFLYAQLDKIPTAGDTITFEHLTFTVLSTRGRRITKVRVQRNDAHQKASEQAAETPSGPLLLPPPEGDKAALSEQPSRLEFREA
jgi:putative hemolysin